MTDNEFSWPKSMELIVLWEFASAVSPTSIGGSGVALFLLAQETCYNAGLFIKKWSENMVASRLFFGKV